MITSFFAGAYGGDDQKLNADSRLECPVCWYVYEPNAGDPGSQIEPGTAFSALPPEWSCPNCGGDRRAFLLLDE